MRAWWALFLGAVLLPACGAIAGGQPAAPSTPLDVHVEFPSTVVFTLREPVQEARDAQVVYRVHRRSCSQVTARGFAETRTGGETFQWTWDIERVGGLPPGTRVSYHWEVTRTDGTVHRTEEEDVLLEDGRFAWQTLSQGPLTLKWHAGDEQFARALLNAAVEGLETLSQETGAQLSGQATLYVYESARELRSALVDPQEWTGGVAFSDYGTIAVAVPPGSTDLGRRVILHELSHLFIGEATFNCYVSPPSWLDEGLATRMEGKTHADFQTVLDRAVEQDDLYTVRGLSGSFPARSQEASLAYAQSLSFVEYLLQEFGGERMAVFLEGFRLGMTGDQALERAYGLDQDAMYRRWRTWRGLPVETLSEAPTAVAGPTPTRELLPQVVATFTPATTPTPSATLTAAATSTGPTPTTERPARQVSAGCLPSPSSEAVASFEGPLALTLALGLFLWRRSPS